jgi:predicted nuclease of restriction endonuclease-like (RecB) superfamily
MKEMEATKYSGMFERIAEIIEKSKQRIAVAVNFEMVQCYHAIGKEIVEEEQKGSQRAEYGKALMENLAKQLTARYGKGFSLRNLFLMRSFYLTYPILHSVSAKLSWTHYRFLLRIEDNNKRSFYEIETVENNWSVRELDRQINSMLFERLAVSKDKQGLIELAKEGQIINSPQDLIKDPYVLEFLEFPQDEKFLEKDLESALIEHLQKFLLELGKGFSFVARQKRISLDNENFYIDLVFYNYVLKCFILVDLKIGKLTHQDLGQMQMYVNYYTRELMNENDNPPIGIVLCADKSDSVVKYTLAEENNQIFASRYQLYLPSEQDLIDEIAKETELIEIYKKQNKD